MKWDNPETFSRAIRIASHCLFDGWIINDSKNGRFMIGYANKSPVLIREFLDDVNFVFGIRPKVRRRKTANEIEFAYKRGFFTLMEFITPEKFFRQKFFNLLIKNRELVKIVLRAFWDDEGTVGFYTSKKTTRKLRARCLNMKLRKQLMILHSILGVPVKEDYDKKGIIIANKNSISLFQSLIDFTSGIKVLDGNMKKTTWKGYDKSIVLEKLVKSYGNLEN